MPDEPTLRDRIVEQILTGYNGGFVNLIADLIEQNVVAPELERRDERIAELEDRGARLELGLSKIQAHGALSDNEQSMIWTARVALNPEAIDLVPAALRDVVAQRFATLSAASGNTETGTEGAC